MPYMGIDETKSGRTVFDSPARDRGRRTIRSLTRDSRAVFMRREPARCDMRGPM
jgi:hypothetical protein